MEPRHQHNIFSPIGIAIGLPVTTLILSFIAYYTNHCSPIILNRTLEKPDLTMVAIIFVRCIGDFDCPGLSIGLHHELIISSTDGTATKNEYE